MDAMTEQQAVVLENLCVTLHSLNAKGLKHHSTDTWINLPTVRLKQKDIAICVQQLFAKFGNEEDKITAKENLKKLGV